MGNTITAPAACFRFPNPNSSAVTLIHYGGAATTLAGKHHLAGKVMFEFPDRMVCHADSFFLGHPIPSLSISDELVSGQTYFLLPLDCFTPNNVLSASSLAALGSGPNQNRAGPARFKDCPFEYGKGSDGRVLIKVTPEFITRLISRDVIKEDNSEISDNDGDNSFLCNTPELRKHYNQLVGNKEQLWSPKLETISECRLRFSPYRVDHTDPGIRPKASEIFHWIHTRSMLAI